VGKSTDTFIGVAWGFATIYHELAWITMIVLWILTLMDDLKYDNIIWFVDIAEYVKYATVYGAYGLWFLLILISSINSTTYFPEAANQTIGIVAAIIYLCVAGIDTFVQLFFEPDL
jgi:hypothetical protein